MDFAFLEKMAFQGFGRFPSSVGEKVSRRLVLYPSRLRFQDLIDEPEDHLYSRSYFLEYGTSPAEPNNSIAAKFRFMASLFKTLPVSSRVQLHLFSAKQDRLYTLITIVAAGLMGIPVDLHDYRFISNRNLKLSRIIYPLVRRLELGDASGVHEAVSKAPSISFRSELAGLNQYRAFRHDRAVPKVLVYGDFERRKIISLAGRTHELIKQKYPRTEFMLVSMTADIENHIPADTFDRSVKIAIPRSEAEVQSFFSDADIVLLLSHGGLNRFMVMRARAAGHPVVTNGIDYPSHDSHIINVVRDSYSGLAEAVIRLVDDEAYYRSFAKS